MNKVDATKLNSLGQSLLDIAVKGLVFLALLIVDWAMSALSNGTISIPHPELSLPIATLLLSQLDSYFINWANQHHVPVPTK